MEDDLEAAIISLFQEQGYDYTAGENIHREYRDILLLDDLRGFLQSQYGNAGLSETELSCIIGKLGSISSTPLYAGSKETFLLINEGFDLQREETSSPPLHVDYIDFETPSNNCFRVVNQYTVQGAKKRRPDLLVFINGIPVAICEFKSATKEDATVHDAWRQITVRYKRDIPNLLRYCFLAVISDGANTRMGSVFTPYEYFFAWSKVHSGDASVSGVPSLKTLIEGAFSPERLVAILRDFVFYPDESGQEQVIVCRYPQFFAAGSMMQNIQEHMRPAGDGKGGTYFGATGCGKTYSMLFLTRMMMRSKVFHNPTILLLVDREDLDSQTSEIFVSARRFLGEEDVRSIEDREDLAQTLKDRPSGGIYVTTIQKFCEDTGLLSKRNNIVCISDEAHRTQVGLGAHVLMGADGANVKYGLAKYLRDSLPNATYCGFTGTPIDATLNVFGDVVDSYTMQEACEDGITVSIAYEPRLARLITNSKYPIESIDDYYLQLAEAGVNPYQIEASKRKMSRQAVLQNLPMRTMAIAEDIVGHYEALCEEKPGVVQKAMIVCESRENAWALLSAISAFRPEWRKPRKASSEREAQLTRDELDKLLALPKINLVATQGLNDPSELYELCGTKEYRKTLDKQFKNKDSNFTIAIVVDMWITGFDVPSLAVMYLDKQIQRHTLVQTISRVNRVFEGKDKGLVIDYIGIKEEMLEAFKLYGTPRGDALLEELTSSLRILRDLLSQIEKLLEGCETSSFFRKGAEEKDGNEARQRLDCLNRCAEFVQTSKEREQRFMTQSKQLKAAYSICAPSGELTEEEMARAQFFLAVRSIIYKQTKEGTPDAEKMNAQVAKMVEQAIQCSGVEEINVIAEQGLELFSSDFERQLKKVKLPISKFHALLKLLRARIREYSAKNKVKAIEFSKRLKKVLERYNARDDVDFVNDVTEDVVDGLSEDLLNIMKDLQKDAGNFREMDISFEEKVFYDILVRVRDTHGFVYEDAKCISLAKEIKALVDEKARFADWKTRNQVKSQLKRDLTVLLYRNGYPPNWNNEVFEKVMEQAENLNTDES